MYFWSDKIYDLEGYEMKGNFFFSCIIILLENNIHIKVKRTQNGLEVWVISEQYIPFFKCRHTSETPISIKLLTFCFRNNIKIIYLYNSFKCTYVSKLEHVLHLFKIQRQSFCIMLKCYFYLFLKLKISKFLLFLKQPKRNIYICNKNFGVLWSFKY